MKTKRICLAVLPLLFTAAAALAQAPQSSIRESTDPARVAEVERRAQALRSAQPTMGAGMQTQTQPQRPAAGEHGRMHGDRMHGNRPHGDRMHHQGGHHGHHGKHHAHPKGAPNSGK